MQIIFDKLQDDGQGSFFINDEKTGKNVFHFLAQVEDNVKLKTTLQKYLDDEKVKSTEENSVKNRIDAIIAELSL